MDSDNILWLPNQQTPTGRIFLYFIMKQLCEKAFFVLIKCDAKYFHHLSFRMILVFDVKIRENHGASAGGDIFLSRLELQSHEA